MPADPALADFVGLIAVLRPVLDVRLEGQLRAGPVDERRRLLGHRRAKPEPLIRIGAVRLARPASRPGIGSRSLQEHLVAHLSTIAL